jgi:hypothetical protein
MVKWGAVLVVLLGLSAVGCESHYQVRGYVYEAAAQKSRVEVVKKGADLPTGAKPVENAIVKLTVYGLTGDLRKEFPPYEYPTNRGGMFEFSLPETIFELPARVLIGAKTKFLLSVERIGFAETHADVGLPLEKGEQLRVILKQPAPIELR